MGQYEISNLNVTCPGGWRFRIPGLDPKVGYISGFHVFRELEDEVVRRYRANGMTAPSNLRELIIDQLCKELPEGYCRSNSPLANFSSRLTNEFSRVVSGTRALWNLWKTGGKTVTQEEAEGRASICAGCVFNRPAIGCPTCGNAQAIMNGLVQEITGGRSTSRDSALTACQICGCDLKAKVWFPLEILDKHMTDEQRAQFPPAYGSQRACWIRKEEAV